MDQSHVELLTRSVNEWNAWRATHHVVVPDFSGADLSRAVLTHAKLPGANMAAANLSFAAMRSVDLSRADLTDAILFGANLTVAGLADANLSHAVLTEANLSGASLAGAIAARASLRNANLTRTTLVNADLSSADLRNAQLSGADMAGADLSGADLSGAILSRANLANANLADAVLHETVLADVDLSRTLGLAVCLHKGPSVLDHRTLLKSGRALPSASLQGCGLPDGLIAFLPSLASAGSPQFHSCFISYATANQDFADRLYADLQTNGVRCWFAPHDMQGGKRIHDQIDEAIQLSDRLLLILSAEAMASSWVTVEIGKARQKERAQNHTVLFPIGLAPFADIRKWQQFDADVGEDVAKAIREFYVPDFSKWKTDHEAYQQEFTRLLAALKSHN